MLTLRAHAKINLSLEVVGRRADGFHDLVSIMQLVDLADTLTLEEAEGIELTIADHDLRTPDNLVYRAATLLQKRQYVNRGCSIRLEKYIPIAAGLGGGSSDAAASLIGLNQLWQAGADCDEIRSMAAELGSDVPFFLYGGTSLVTGRGEGVSRIPEAPVAWWLLVNPGFAVRTADVFKELRPDEWSSGERTRHLARSLQALGTTTIGVNALQAALFRVEPRAEQCFQMVETIAPGRTIVAGSGPTVGALFDDRGAAETARSLLTGTGYWITIVKTLSKYGWEAPCSTVGA